VQADNSSTDTDPYHFSPEGMRELGKRYAQAFLAHADNSYIPRKGSVIIKPERAAMYQKLKSEKARINIYSLTGRVIGSYSTPNMKNALSNLKSGGIYIINYKFTDEHSVTVPFLNN
jgi:hypothetical protein